MVAEIFRRHDVFFGDTWRPEDGKVGYNEHKWLKKAVRKHREPDCYERILRGKDASLRIPNFPSLWRQHLITEGYQGGPWGLKVDAFCTPLLHDLQATLVKLWRDPDAIQESCLKALRRFEPYQWKRIIFAHHAHMKSLRGPDIDTDAVVQGNYSSLRRAFEASGLLFRAEIADRVIRR